MAGWGDHKLKRKGREAPDEEQKRHTRRKPDYSVEELEGDIEQVSKAYARFSQSRARDAIYNYLEAAYRVRLKWKKRIAAGFKLRTVVRRQYPDQMIGRAKKSLSRLIVKLSATKSDNKTQAKYTNVLNYALVNKKKVSEVVEFLRNAQVKTSNGKTMGGINACESRYRRRRLRLGVAKSRRKLAIRRMGAARPRTKSN